MNVASVVFYAPKCQVVAVTWRLGVSSLGSGRRLWFLSDTIEATVKSHTLIQYKIIVPRNSLRSKQAEIFSFLKILSSCRVVRGYSTSYVSVIDGLEERFSRRLLLSEMPRVPITTVLRSKYGIWCALVLSRTHRLRKALLNLTAYKIYLAFSRICGPRPRGPLLKI